MKIAEIIASLIGLISLYYGMYYLRHSHYDDAFTSLLLSLIFLTGTISGELIRKVKELLKKK